MALVLHRGPALGAASDAVRQHWRARGGLLVVRDREAATAALAADAGPDGVVLDRAAVTLAGLRDRVRRAAGLPDARPPSGIATRMALDALLAQRLWPGWGASARAPGFLAVLERGLTELRAARVTPRALRAAAGGDSCGTDLAELYAAAGDAALPLAPDLEWEAADAAAGLTGFPAIGVDGLDDLTPPGWALLRALGRVADVAVALVHEPGRRAYAARHARQAAWADEADAVHRHPPAPRTGRAPELAALDSGLFEDRAGIPGRGEGAVRLVGAAGTRGMHRAALEEVLAAHRAGTPLAEVALVVPRLAEARDDLDRLLADWDVPARRSTRMRVLEAPLGLALARLLELGEREAGEIGALDPLLGWLRSGYAGADLDEVDRFEVAMRRAGRGAAGGGALMARWSNEAIAPASRLVAAARGGPAAQVAALVSVGWEALARRAAATGQASQRGPDAADRRDQAALGVLAGLSAGLGDTAPAAGEDEDLRHRGPLPRGALGRLVADLTFADREGPADGLLVTDPAGLRGRRLRVVVVAGLDDLGLPARPAPDALLGPLRARLPELPPRAAGTDESRLRFLQAVAAAGERLVLVRRTADDDGREVAASPYWAEVCRLLGRPLDHLDRSGGADGELIARGAPAPTLREALRRLAADHRSTPGELAGALARRTRVRGLPGAPLATRARFRVTELETYLSCPYGWLHGRMLAPRPIAEVFDAAAEGTLAHEVLHHVYRRVREEGGARCDAGGLPAYLEALPEALATVLEERRPPEAGRVFEAFALRIGRHLEGLLRREAARAPRFDPHAFEVELSVGELLGPLAPPAVVGGRADRIDLSPDGRIAVAIDYKRSRAEFDPTAPPRERLQLPLYAEAAARAAGDGRQSGGGLYVVVTRDKVAGAVRGDAGYAHGLPPAALVGAAQWHALVADAVAAAADAVSGIRAGDLGPPPEGCPTWCGHGDLWR